MPAFIGRRSRLTTLFNYVIAIAIYTVVVVYIAQYLKEPVASIKSGARREDATVDNALDDERQHSSDRPLFKSNSSPINNSGEVDDDNDDDNDREKESTDKELMQQSTAAVNNNQLTNKAVETTPKVVRLLCWLMTDPAILNRCSDARDSWMQECDIRLFMSSKANKKFPAIGLNVSAGRDHIAEKSKAAWTYIYENHRNDADFFVKADPDSYIVVENLRRYLANCNPDEPAIYGHNLYYNYTRTHYVAGEAVVLGRESLNRLVTKGMLRSDCFAPGQAEDLKTCMCLSKVGGYTVDTRDENGRETFLPPFQIEHITPERLPGWYTNFYRKPYGHCQSIDCLSYYPIVFHYVTHGQFSLMNYLLRNFRHQLTASDADPQFRFNGTRYYYIRRSSSSNKTTQLKFN